MLSEEKQVLIDAEVQAKDAANKACVDEMTALLKLSLKWNNDKIELWMETPNTNFGGISAIDMIARGRGDKAVRVVANLIEENGKSWEGDL